LQFTDEEQAMKEECEPDISEPEKVIAEFLGGLVDELGQMKKAVENMEV
jgi:hypothetical protein